LALDNRLARSFKPFLPFSGAGWAGWGGKAAKLWTNGLGQAVSLPLPFDAARGRAAVSLVVSLPQETFLDIW